MDENENEGKFDKDVMDMEFKKYTPKNNNKSKHKQGGKKDINLAKPVNQRGKVTMEQMLTAPHSPYYEVRVGQAVFLRQAANDEFAKNNLDDAIKLYERALYHCDFSDSKIKFNETEEQKQSLRDATDPVYLNLARCYLKKKEYHKAINNARASVHANSTELHKTKAKFLEGKAFYHLKEYDRALAILEKGAESINDETERKENTNLLQQSILQSDYQELLKLVREGQARHKVHDAKVWGGVLKKGDNSENSDNEKGTSNNVFSSPIILVGSFIVFMAALYIGSRVHNDI